MASSSSTAGTPAAMQYRKALCLQCKERFVIRHRALRQAAQIIMLTPSYPVPDMTVSPVDPLGVLPALVYTGILEKLDAKRRVLCGDCEGLPSLDTSRELCQYTDDPVLREMREQRLCKAAARELE